MKKTLIIFIIFITGCIKYTDLNNLSIIKSIGISYDESYTLYAEIYDEIKKDNEPKTIIIKVQDEDIASLFEKLKIEANKELFFSHIDLLLLDNTLSNKNYNEIIDYFIKNKYLRNDFNCILTKDIKKIIYDSQYNEIENYLKANKESKNIINISFNEIIENYLNNKPFYLSMINYDNKIIYDGNYVYYHNSLERIQNEKN